MFTPQVEHLVCSLHLAETRSSTSNVQRGWRTGQELASCRKVNEESQLNSRFFGMCYLLIGL
jgi:hypothetical protein